MNRYILCTLVVGTLASVYGCSNVPKDELQGTWTGVSAENGEGSLEESDNPVSGYKIMFTDDKCVMSNKKKTTEMTYKVDETSSQKSIDLLIDLPGGRTAIERGIYCVEGDTLTLRLTKEVDQPRPTSFIVKKGDT